MITWSLLPFAFHVHVLLNLSNISQFGLEQLKSSCELLLDNLLLQSNVKFIVKMAVPVWHLTNAVVRRDTWYTL